jgi:hypothetical protein
MEARPNGLKGRERGMWHYRQKYPKQTLTERLTALGFRSYRAYLASEHWLEVGRRYRAEAPLQECYVCEAPPPFQLHHRTYARLGHETLRDFVPLCARCHANLHQWVKVGSGRGTRFFTAARAMRMDRTGETKQQASERLFPPQ